MASTPDVVTVIAGMTSDAESARKLAAYHLQSLLADHAFADAFVQADGIPVLRRLVLEENGNALAYALGSLTRLLDIGLGWEEGVSSVIIERAVQLVVSRPVINVLRNVLHLLVLVVSRPLDQLSTTRPATPGSTKSFALESLLPALQTQESFLECLVDKLSSADHVLCANALYLINALMRDSIVNAGDDEWPKFIKRLQELGVINGVEALMRGESLRDLAEPILEFQGLNKVLLSRWKDVRVDVEIPEHRRALRQLHALSFPSDYQRTGSVKSINPRNKSPRPLEDIRDNKWRRLGFRSQSPATEFEETGFLSMMDLIEYVRTNLDTYQETLLEQSVLPVEQRCPIARASLSVTAMLYEYFDVDSIKTRDATKGAEHIRDVERMVQPLLLLWARVHAATLNAFMRLWNEARASQKEFHKIEHLVRLLIRKVLDSADRRSSTSQVEDEFGTISLQSIRQLQLAEMDSDFSENWGTDLRKLHEHVHAEALQFMREQRVRCLLQGSWFPVLSNVSHLPGDALSPTETITPTVSSWRFVQVSPDRKFLQYASLPRKLGRVPHPAELTRTIDLNTISSVDSSVSRSKLPADWDAQTPKLAATTANEQTTSPATITRLTIYGQRLGSPRPVDGEDETVLLELNTPSPSLASEWLDGLLMLLNQQPITADTHKLVDILEKWSLKVRMLNLQWEDAEWLHAQHGVEHNRSIASREGLDGNFWYDMNG